MVCHIELFAWALEFDEEYEPVCMPVWVFLPGLLPYLYHNSVLKSLTMPIGQFICSDNPTLCAIRTDGACVCSEVDASREPISHFWIEIFGFLLVENKKLYTRPSLLIALRANSRGITCRLAELGRKIEKRR